MPRPTRVPKPNTRRDVESGKYIEQPVDVPVKKKDEITLPVPAFMACKNCIAGPKCPEYRADGSCVLLQQVYDSITKQVPEFIPNYVKGDELLIQHLANLAVLISRAHIYFGKVDYFIYEPGKKGQSPTVKAQPLFKDLRALMRDYEDTCDKLGLTPVARARIKSATPDGILSIPVDHP